MMNSGLQQKQDCDTTLNPRSTPPTSSHCTINARKRIRRRTGLLLLLSLACLSRAIGQELKNQDEERQRIGRDIEVYDFETRGNDPNSRDRDGDGWPDYWILVKDDRHKDYMAKSIRIVEDTTGSRPGLYRNQPGHVLRVPFDGTPVALRTLYAKSIDPDLAYEVSAWVRTSGLFAPEADPARGPTTFIRLRLVWLYVEAKYERQIGSPFIINLDAGQTDWPETPVKHRINDLPMDTDSGLRPNAVRLILEMEDNPLIPGADRHGTAWFDDIRIRSRPKLQINPALVNFVPHADAANPARKIVNLQVNAMGLTDNIPLPDRPGSFSGKTYSLAVGITDINGDSPLDQQGRPLKYEIKLQPGTKRSVTRTLAIPLRRLGIFYLTINLKGYKGELLAEVSQVIVLWPPPRASSVKPYSIEEGGSGFGIRLGSLPAAILRKRSGLVSGLLRRIGVRQVKSHVWPANFKPREKPQVYLADLAREFRNIRGLGAHITGVIAGNTPDLAAIPMSRAMKEKADILGNYLVGSMPYIRPHIESWQWGRDDDPSFSALIDETGLLQCRNALGNMAAATIQAFPVNLGQPKVSLPSSKLARTISLYIPASMNRGRMMQIIRNLLPRYFARLRTKYRYPPQSLLDLTPEFIDGEKVSNPGNIKLQHEAWISLELVPVSDHERNAMSERMQMEDMATKAIMAKALGFHRIFLGRLFDNQRGLAMLDNRYRPIPRPAFLAAHTLQKLLGNSVYIGSFQLRDEFPNYVFRLPDRDLNEVVVAIWYNGPGEFGKLPRAYLGDLPLATVDLAGNIRQLPQRAPLLVRKAPVFITGISVPLALTRMSIRIKTDPPLRTTHKLQQQVISLTNHFPSQLPVTMRTVYAADIQRFKLERGWTVRPEQRKIDLPSPRKGRALPTGELTFNVQPDPQSHIGVVAASNGNSSGLVWPPKSARNGRKARFGEKYMQIITEFNSAQSVRMNLLRKTRLTSDLEVKLFKLKKRDSRRVYLQMQIRWIPQSQANAQRELQLRPYFLKKGRLPTRLPMATVPAYLPGETGKPAVTIEFPVPRYPRTKTMIGLEEEGGTRFFILDVTALIQRQ